MSMLNASIGIALALMAATPAQAALRAIGDEEMSDVWGQAILQLTDTVLTTPPAVTGSQAGIISNGPPVDSAGNPVTGAIHYTRLSVGAEIDLDADIGKINLGAYNGGTDVSLNSLTLTGYKNGNNAYQPFHISDPYIEIAMSQGVNGAPGDVLGFRIGAAGVDGILQFNLSQMSGRLLATSVPVTDATSGQAGSLTLDTYGVRSTGTAVSSISSQGTVTNAYQNVGGLCLGRTGAQGSCGDATAATQDFFIAYNKVSNLFYPNASGAADYTPTQKGVWVNATDNVRLYQIKDLTGSLSMFNTANPQPARRW